MGCDATSLVHAKSQLIVTTRQLDDSGAGKTKPAVTPMTLARITRAHDAARSRARPARSAVSRTPSRLVRFGTQRAFNDGKGTTHRLLRMSLE
jgi:hypothetical protein